MKLSATSIVKLTQCHPDLANIVKEAASLSPVDFTIGETLRSIERQKQLLASGASHTMNSRHLPHKGDGLSYAVDLIALEAGAPSWHWPLYYQLADAMKLAAFNLKLPLEWGGAFGIRIDQFIGSAHDASMQYVANQKAKGLSAFLDGPHYQLPWHEYP